MKKISTYVLLLLLTITSFSCKEKKGFPKPEGLVGEKQMVNILYDIHLNEAYFDHFRMKNQIKKIKSKDLYFSVLSKYGIADSVFSQSVVYYSSMPKIYEKIYQQVIDRLNMLQEANNQQKEVNIGTEK